MKDLLLFYLLNSATQVLPVICIKLCLTHGIPIPSLRNILGRRTPVNLELRNIGTSRFEQLFQLFDSDHIMYLARLSLLNSFLQLAGIILISLAIQFDVPIPHITNFTEWLSEDLRSDLLRFSITTGAIQLMPMIFLFSALFLDIPLPFMPTPPENRAPPSSEIMRWEQDTEDIATIRLTRFKNSERTLIFANCQDDRFATGFKFLLYQENEPNVRTECYVYHDNKPFLDKINPAPVTVSELEKIFSPVQE